MTESKPTYVELHACSAFSFLEGASLPEEIADACAAQDQPAVALLDRDNLASAVRFYKRAKRLGLRAHIGALVTGPGGARYPLLAESRTGYQNLCRLLTRIKLRDGKQAAQATAEDFAEFAAGLVCLTGDETGPLAAAIPAGPQAARACLEELVSSFGEDNVYVELQRHRLRDQEARNQQAVALARSLRLPLLATNGPRYAERRQRDLHDVLTAIRHKTTIAQAGRLLSRNRERYLKSSAQMRHLFADLPEAIAHTSELSNRLQFQLCDFGYEFPRYPTPPGETMQSVLEQLTLARAPERFRPYTEKARRQLERELQLIGKLDLAGYFLIVWEISEFCRANGILSQGRGSAANSAVCYALGITAVDPVRMDLLFERFLSEERGEWPDIDIDLPSGAQRERVIQHVYARYGVRGAAMTANVITYRGRLAVREVGKALGFDEETLSRIAKLVPIWGWKDASDTHEKRFREAGLDPANPMVGHLLRLANEIQDLPRHLGQHSGGMVICQGQLDSIVPLEPATMPGRVILQWDKEDCAAMGLVKVDLLGLGMMAVLEETAAVIGERFGETVDLAHLPQDDPAVYAALQKADTIGMFQVESRAQMSCLPRLRPQCFYDICVQVAIIRPGPIVGRMLHPYLRRRQGKEPAVSLHPSLDAVLARTLGVPLFQEQLLRMAMIAANFTGGQAEELRRAFGFKHSEKAMREVEVQLRAGMNANGITGQTQDTIVQCITSFATYGFPESHAISFALLSYASAYLKCHYLAPFTAALLNHQPMGFYSSATVIQDAQRHGLRVLPVHVNESAYRCEVIDRATIRLGLASVRGLPQAVAESLLRERFSGGPFRSAEELARRVQVLRRDHLRQLAAIGALNFNSKSHRRTALWEAARLERPSGGLFRELEEKEDSSTCPLAPMTSLERLNADLHGTGVTVGRHPVAHLRARLDQLGVTPAAKLAARRNGAAVRVAGCVIARQRPGTAKGFAFLSLEDETGISNVILEPETFEHFRSTIVATPFLLFAGTLQNLEGVISVKAHQVEALPARMVGTGSHDFH